MLAMKRTGVRANGRGSLESWSYRGSPVTTGFTEPALPMDNLLQDRLGFCMYLRSVVYPQKKLCNQRVMKTLAYHMLCKLVVQVQVENGTDRN
jgi:hypothetical protein